MKKENKELGVADEKEQLLQIKEKELIGLIKDIEGKKYKEEEKRVTEREKLSQYEEKINYFEETLAGMENIPIKTIEESIYKSSVDRVKYLNNKLKDFESVNLLAVEEFKELDERYNFIKSQKEDLRASRSSLLEIIERYWKLHKREIFTLTTI